MLSVQRQHQFLIHRARSTHINQSPANCKFVVGAIKIIVALQQLCSGSICPHRFQIRIDVSNDERTVFLGYSNFFIRNVGKRWTSELHVIECNVGDDRNFRAHHIGGIPSAQHAHFNDSNIHCFVGKVSKGCGSDNFKIGRSHARNNFGVCDCRNTLGEGFLSNWHAIARNALS